MTSFAVWTCLRSSVGVRRWVCQGEGLPGLPGLPTRCSPGRQAGIGIRVRLRTGQRVGQRRMAQVELGGRRCRCPFLEGHPLLHRHECSELAPVVSHGKGKPYSPSSKPATR